MKSINIIKIILLLVGILGSAAAIYFIYSDLALNGSYYLKHIEEGGPNVYYASQRLLFFLSILVLVGVFFEIIVRNISGFIGISIAASVLTIVIFSPRSYSVGLPLLGHLLGTFAEPYGLPMTTLIITGLITGLLEIWRAGFSAAQKTMLTTANLLSTSILILFVFLASFVPSSGGHPNIPNALLLVPLSVVALIVWAKFLRRILRNDNVNITSHTSILFLVFVAILLVSAGVFLPSTRKVSVQDAREAYGVIMRDGRRIQNIQMTKDMLMEYKIRSGQYPKDLNELLQVSQNNDAVAYRIYEVVDDPMTTSNLPHGTTLIHYATRAGSDGKINAYHLGNSLEKQNPDYPYDPERRKEDSDFNSKAAGWINGFEGDDVKPCGQYDKGKFCYDIKVED